MKLFFTLRRYAPRKHLATAVVLGMISGGLSTGLLFLINQYLFQWGDEHRYRVGIAFAAVLPLVALSRYASALTLSSLGFNTSYDLQIQLTRRILAAPMRRLEEQGSHRLLVALTEDIGSLADVLATIPSFFINLAIVLGCLTYMGWLNWRLLLVVLVFLVIGILTYILPMRAGVRRQRLAREVEDDLFHHFRGVTQGTKELKMRRERRWGFLGQLRETASGYRDLRFSASRIFIAAVVWGNVLLFVVLGLLMFLLPSYVEGLTTSVLASFMVLLLYLMGPMQVILNEFPMLTRADIAVRKIERLGISLSDDLADDEGQAREPLAWKRLELRGLTHTYKHEDEADEFTLGPIDLDLHAGELVFVIGGNGSGKTSLAKVLLGLYPPDGGEIRLDGRPVDDESREDYRQLFSVVFSDFFLFESLLGLGGSDLDERARDYLERLQLRDKVRVQDGRLSTIDLSQGQRKRLALMATLLEDRPIYLFDEWAADQDPDFKKVYYHQLLPALRDQGKLVIVISHDDQYYRVGDRVIKLDYGRVVYDQRVEDVRPAQSVAG